MLSRVVRHKVDLEKGDIEFRQSRNKVNVESDQNQSKINNSSHNLITQISSFRPTTTEQTNSIILNESSLQNLHLKENKILKPNDTKDCKIKGLSFQINPSEEKSQSEEKSPLEEINANTIVGHVEQVGPMVPTEVGVKSKLKRNAPSKDYNTKKYMKVLGSLDDINQQDDLQMIKESL